MDSLIQDKIDNLGYIKEKNIETIEKINGESLDIVKQNVLKLKEIFPEVFCEDKVDFERLQEVLGNYIDDKEERYRFEWHGKSKAIRISQTPSRGTLRPCKEESKNWDTTENLYIEGDNLEVLKLIQKSYQNKIKMIYIDPPYNTGNDFVYKDDYKDNLKNYLEITGQVDEDGNRISTNSEGGGRYHTNWLNMMYPRLRLAKNLLSNDGIIFISIDDNEYSNLKKVCDEIFGEINFMSCITVKMSESSGVKMSHANIKPPKLKEYILMYKKSSSTIINPVKITKTQWDDEYNTILMKVNKDEMKILNYIASNNIIDKHEQNIVDNILKKAFPISLYEYFKKNNITNEKEKLNFKFQNSYRIFRTTAISSTSTEKIKKYINENNIVDEFLSYITPKNELYFIKNPFNNNNKKPRLQVLFANNYLEANPGDFWTDIKTTGLDNEGGVPYKNGKKPIELIKRLLSMIKGKDFIILDFFSGSATTAEAIMRLNAADKCNRKYIMVQLPENLNNTYDSYIGNAKKQVKETVDFLDSINKSYCLSEIGKERIRRAGDKIIEENKDKEGIDDLDIGFKVFKLDSSNIKPWNPNYNNLEMTLEDNIDNFVPGRTEEDVVYEIMLKYGIDLTYPVETRTIKGKKVFSIGFGALIICLDNEITLDVAQGMVDLKNELNPEISRFVFKDNGFETDFVKTNVIEILKRNNIKDIMSI